MERVLELLEARGVRATFFVLGETAEAHPGAISRIARAGHGLASHGYRHVPVDLLGPAGFAADLDRSIAVLEACAGRRPGGYRAPIWSLASAPWAFEVLVSRGFRFDSSLAPVPPLGSASLPSRPTLLRRGPGTILEVPPLSAAFGPWRYPVGFAMGLRALPAPVIRRAIERENRLGLPALVAVHTWELDPDPPALRLAPALALAHGFGLEKVAGRLDALLGALPFGSIEEALADGATWAAPPAGGGALGEAA